jgi:hypothetical protein
MGNLITVHKTTRGDYIVMANGKPCWRGTFGAMSHQASGLAKDLGWKVLFQSKIVNVI